ncbi:hypothetical protein GCM10023176_35310 [Micromonospora coerulea]|uniref:Uncharacterized protein n=1 Tax=Micromonospora coerulea TaxID=47856 RepID=A0ABP8SPJ0_9ACTN
MLGVEFTKQNTGEHGETLGHTKLWVNDTAVAEGPMRISLRGRAVRRPLQQRPGQRRLPGAGRVQGCTTDHVEIYVGQDQYLDLRKSRSRPSPATE